MSFAFLLLSLVGLWLARNAWRPLPDRGVGPLWLPALVTGELAPWQGVVQASLAGVAVWQGFAGGWTGGGALVVTGASLVLLAVVHRRAVLSRPVLETATAEMIGAGVRLPRLPAGRLLRPIPGLPSGVDSAPDLAYGPDPSHVADRYRRGDATGRAPVLVQIHGGGWTGGRRRRQGVPLMLEMVRRGWVVFDIAYRLSPAATFPDQLTDVKRAVAWFRRSAADHGADPGFIVVTGGSAGGQLAALAALTGDDRSLQPGFADEDASVQGCIPLYGVHDLLDRSGTAPKWPYLATHVLKSDPADDPQAWADASPIRSVTADRPPFFVAHGALDSLVRAGESRRLVEALRAAGGSPAGYAELPGATHGFDSLNSVRSARFVQAAAAVLEHWWAQHRRAVAAVEGRYEDGAPCAGGLRADQ